MSLGALRDAIASSERVVVCDMCGFFALREECRDGRSVDALLRHVCSWCCIELACAEDEALGAVCAGACGCSECC